MVVGLWFDPFGKIPEFTAKTLGEPWKEKSGLITESLGLLPIRSDPIG